MPQIHIEYSIIYYTSENENNVCSEVISMHPKIENLISLTDTFGVIIIWSPLFLHTIFECIIPRGI